MPEIQKSRREIRKAEARVARVPNRQIPDRAPVGTEVATPWAASATAKTAKKKSKSPLSVLATMAMVGGMFAVLGLPAYASTNQQAAPDAADLTGAQTITVSAEAVSSVSARDGYTATTPEELAQQKAAVQAAAIAATYSSSAISSGTWVASGPRDGSDDYPFSGGEGLSPMNYYMGECTDFVAWRLNRDAGSYGSPFHWVWSNLTPTGGSANQWQSAWEAHGWTVSSTPVPGAVAVTEWQHVAYVKQVNEDGTVGIEEYNYGNYHQYGQRTISAGSVIAFLYPPW